MLCKTSMVKNGWGRLFCNYILRNIVQWIHFGRAEHKIHGYESIMKIALQRIFGDKYKATCIAENVERCGNILYRIFNKSPIREYVIEDYVCRRHITEIPVRKICYCDDVWVVCSS